MHVIFLFKICQSGIALASHFLSHGPSDWVQNQKDRADIRNIPSVGSPLNTGFVTSSQLNIARAMPCTAKIALSGSLGAAGKSHRDMHDHGPSLSAMFNFGNLHGLHPGYFFLLELGVFVQLQNYTLLAFSGLQTHGGSPPRPISLDSPFPAQAIRLTFIAYPNKGIMEGTESTVLAMSNSSGRSAIELGGSSGTSLNMVQHSNGILDTDSYLQYTSRALLQLCTNIIKQMPEDRQLAIDSDLFMRSFSSSSRNIKVPEGGFSWANAPNGHNDKEGTLKTILSKLEDYEAQACDLIPSLQRHVQGESVT